MLLNNLGRVVKVNPKFNSKEHPNMFKHLREVKEPSEVGHGNMFHFGTRAKFKDNK